VLPHSFQLCGKCDAAFLHAGADGAVVGFCDALGDGEAQTASFAGRSGAGGVRPVEAVKQAVQRPVRRLDSFVFHRKADAAPERFERDSDLGMQTA
jgi:hypothetical protein